METQVKVYGDVIVAIGMFVLCDLDPGSLGQAMLYGCELDELTQLCHPVGVDTLPYTTTVVDKFTRSLFHGISPDDKEALYDARVLLKLSGRHLDWWAECYNNDVLSMPLVEPFSLSDFKGSNT